MSKAMALRAATRKNCCQFDTDMNDENQEAETLTAYQ